jgi:hypothetical protein
VFSRLIAHTLFLSFFTSHSPSPAAGSPQAGMKFLILTTIADSSKLKSDGGFNSRSHLNAFCVLVMIVHHPPSGF